MFTYIAYEHIHLAPAAQVLSTHNCCKVLSNCLIYQQAQLQQPPFVSLSKITCHECQQHNSLST